MICGGVGAVQPATEETQKVIEAVKDAVHSQTSNSYEHYQAVSFATQVVAGVNYFVKVKVRSNEFVHLRIYRPLPFHEEKYELHSLQAGKSEHDPINHFQ